MYRRNLVIDAAADGGHLLGESTATENVIIDCPLGLDMTGGVGYETRQPNGVMYQASYNAIIGSADLTSTDPRGYGILYAQRQAGQLGAPQPAGPGQQYQRLEPHRLRHDGGLRQAELHGLARQRLI